MNHKKASPRATSIREKTVLVFMGLLLSLVLLEAGMRLGGFLFSSIQAYQNFQSIKQKGAYRILCLGESTTFSQYPRLLEQVLNRHPIGIRFSVIDRGRPGTNTPAILSRVESYLTEYHPNMVVAMMGINDQDIRYSQGISESPAWIFQHFRVYRLGRILYRHLLTKFQEKDVKKSGLKNEGIDLELRKAIERDPKNDKAYAELGRLCKDQGKFQQAMDYYSKAIEINPKNDKAYVELGQIYYRIGASRLTGDIFKKAIEINPKNDAAYLELGRLYQKQGEYRQAEESFKRAIELNPKNSLAFFELGLFYRDQGNLPQTEDLFKKAIGLDPENERILGAMVSLYEEMGKPDLAKANAEMVNRLRVVHYPAITVNSYRKLKEILDRKGIKLVCVQYPMRNVEVLKKIFENDKGVAFVSNESVFEDAVRKESYKEYFRDMFGGDFGHCTQKGNMLLAQNIADVILKEVLKK